ncbi:MAG TPA: lactonase family protein [Terracidiphilus sp.]|nr:lactonase family protein [Terracidiphilus sp.]
MKTLNRREFVAGAAAATLTVTSKHAKAAGTKTRVLVASGTENGILNYDWNGATGTLTPAGVAAKISTVDWITFSPDRKYIFAACELDSFRGKPTGEVASFAWKNSELHPLSEENSAAKGTCHVAVDHTGQVAISADYGGGSAASYKITKGKLSAAVWKEHYTQHGPNKDRQEAAHAHFCSFSPDNRFAYVNDLGGDCIHIYMFEPATAELMPAGTYHGRPGSGCRTLHFHPNGHIAYCMDELASTVDVLSWNKRDGLLRRIATVELLPKGYSGPTRGCDTVITRDGRFVYFANRDNDFLASYSCDPETGLLTFMARSNCGGKIPRNFTLDPTERWMIVANQDSNLLSVFARDPKTGRLADKGKSVAAATPMCILFT